MSHVVSTYVSAFLLADLVVCSCRTPRRHLTGGMLTVAECSVCGKVIVERRAAEEILRRALEARS